MNKFERVCNPSQQVEVIRLLNPEIAEYLENELEEAHRYVYPEAFRVGSLRSALYRAQTQQKQEGGKSV